METFATGPSDGGVSPVHLHVYRDGAGRTCAYVTVAGRTADAGPAGLPGFGTGLGDARRAAAEIARTAGAGTVVVFDPLGLAGSGRQDEGLHPEELNAANDD